ncbi:MAG: hypothetical protein ABIZ36_03545 [Gemmatimonadaceae bacterium]
MSGIGDSRLDFRRAARNLGHHRGGDSADGSRNDREQQKQYYDDPYSA